MHDKKKMSKIKKTRKQENKKTKNKKTKNKKTKKQKNLPNGVGGVPIHFVAFFNVVNAPK